MNASGGLDVVFFPLTFTGNKFAPYPTYGELLFSVV
mgnify:CR=1 FL=1